jgi:hypothetical protein
MDSDDVIDEANGRKLRALVESLCSGERLPLASTHASEPVPDVTADSILGCVMQVRCPREGPDGSYDFTVVDHCKLLRNRPDLRFAHRIHEQIMPAINRAGGDATRGQGDQGTRRLGDKATRGQGERGGIRTKTGAR